MIGLSTKGYKRLKSLVLFSISRSKDGLQKYDVLFGRRDSST